MNVESYRRRAALDRKHGPGRPPHPMMSEKTLNLTLSDNQSSGAEKILAKL